MKNGNKTVIIIIFAVVALAVVVVGGIMLFKYFRPAELIIDDLQPNTNTEESIKMKDDIFIKPGDKNYVENQVLATADSKSEAKKIAEAIGGELISYESQVATIQIGITVEEMMQRLEEDPSLPRVYPNYQNYQNYSF